MQNTVTIEILNDLIQINNDRIKGYTRAIEELKDDDTDLKVLFETMIDQSREARNALGREVQVLGADMDTGTTVSGKIYKAWMDIKAVFSGHDRKTVLANCEFGEDAAQRAYDAALNSENLPHFLREMVEQQKRSLREAHDQVRALRDSVV